MQAHSLHNQHSLLGTGQQLAGRPDRPVAATIGRFSSAQLPYDDPQAEDVHLCSDTVTSEHLRGDVREGPAWNTCCQPLGTCWAQRQVRLSSHHLRMPFTTPFLRDLSTASSVADAYQHQDFMQGGLQPDLTSRAGRPAEDRASMRTSTHPRIVVCDKCVPRCRACAKPTCRNQPTALSATLHTALKICSQDC